MYRQTVTFTNELGMYARLGGYLTQTSNNFQSEVTMEYGERRANVKSLLGLLSLGPTKRAEVCLVAEGPDEIEAVETLCEIIRDAGAYCTGKKRAIQKKQDANKRFRFPHWLMFFRKNQDSKHPGK